MEEDAALIVRIEAASEGSRELDVDIAYALGIVPKEIWREHLTPDAVDPYTTSIDAALTLVPEGWDASVHYAGASAPAGRRGGAVVRNSGLIGDPVFSVHHKATPALALCIAALRSRSGAAPAESDAPKANSTPTGEGK